MKALATAAVLVAMTLALSPSMTSARIPEPRAPSSVSSGRLLYGGRVSCSATVKSSVQVGHAVSVRFALRNLSKHSIKLAIDWELFLKAADGTTYDPGVPFRGLPRPPMLPIKIARGATKIGRIDVPVRWNGPLRIRPLCEQARLPVLRVDVTSSGPPRDTSSAVAAVAAASLHLLDHCRPQTPGVAVNGQIDPPSGNAPPMSAQCSVSIEPEGTFSVAQVLVLIPPGLTGVTVLQPYELFAPPYVPFGPPPPFAPPYEAIAWEFVVTADGALPVAAATTEASCGATAFAWGTYPSVEFISACSS
jgi:hypothetical protein